MRTRAAALAVGSAVCVVAVALAVYKYRKRRRNRTTVTATSEMVYCDERTEDVCPPPHTLDDGHDRSYAIDNILITEASSRPGALPVEQILGATLLAQDGSTVSTRVLEGKPVALYFSAHWCKPCREFTPLLRSSYDHLRTSKGMEIVFVSQCSDAREFAEYFQEMPWYALPYVSPLRHTLARRYKVTTLPTLVVLSADGRVETLNGRAAVQADPQGARFPWRQPVLADVVGASFVDARGGSHGREVLAGPVTALYFAAGWISSSGEFTSRLVALHRRLAEKGVVFNVIYVSGDRNVTMFNEMFSGMPWVAVPFADVARRDAITRALQIEDMGPTLVLLDADLNVVTRDGYCLVEDPEGSEYPWLLPDVAASARALPCSPCLFLFVERELGVSDEAQRRVCEVVERFANQTRRNARATNEDVVVHCFAARRRSPTSSSLRSLANLEERGALLVLFDAPDAGAFYVYDGDVIALMDATLTDFVGAWWSGKLERGQLRET